MYHPLRVLLLVASSWLITSAQDQNFYFGPPQGRFVPNFQQPNDFSNFRQTGYQDEIDSYLPQRDLQTSDLPLHLQQTLPQYRFPTVSTKQPSSFQLQFQGNQPPQAFRNNRPEQIVPSTHRPNYSHLFKSHHNPSQTETFLGEITIESPAELPPEFANRGSPFKPSGNLGWNEHQEGKGWNEPQRQVDKTATFRPNNLGWNEQEQGKPFRFPDPLNTVDHNFENTKQKNEDHRNNLAVGNSNRGTILNHRTRIFAPENESDRSKPQTNDYFVDNNGEVFGTKIARSTTTPIPATTLHRRFPFKLIPTTKPTTTTHRAFNIGPLLEDLKEETDNSNHKNDVEVIQSSVTLPPDQFFTLAPRDSSETSQEEEYDEELTTDYDYKSTSQEEAQSTPSSKETTESSRERERTTTGKEINGGGEEINGASEEISGGSEETNNEEEEPIEEAVIKTKPKKVGKSIKLNKTEEDEEASNAVETSTSATNKESTTKLSEEEPNYTTTEISEAEEDDEEEDNTNTDALKKLGEAAEINAEEPAEGKTESSKLETTEKTFTDSSQEVLESENVSAEVEDETNDVRSDEKLNTIEVTTKKSDERVKVFSRFGDEDSDESATQTFEETSTSASTTTITPTKNYEVLTMKPSTMVKDDNFRGFIDSTVIDLNDDLESTAVTKTTSMESSEDQSKEIIIEPVVSVVTTKSVVNNTIIGTITPSPLPTEQMSPPTPPSIEDTSDTWVIVASVQTSRSVSGARYLPSAVVEQETRTKLLNEERTKENSTVKPNTSTESLIDKLDRVQSDLSSSLLSGGFNNITVITEGDKHSATTIIDMEVTTTVKPPQPAVVIKKFSANARPPRPTYKPKYQTRPSKKPSTTLSYDLSDLLQADEPQNSGRSSGISLKNAVVVQDVSKFLPPGYKPPKEEVNSGSLLEEILKNVKKDKEAPSNATVKFNVPVGYKPAELKPTVESIMNKTKVDDISKFLPPGYKPKATTSTQKPIVKPIEDISAFLPPGYKVEPTPPPKTIDISAFLPPGYKSASTAKPLKGVTLDDISAFLPPGYKATTVKPAVKDDLPSSTTAKPDDPLKSITLGDISAFLPPGFKASTTAKPSDPLKGITLDDISAFLPPGYKSGPTPPPKTQPKQATTTPKPDPPGTVLKGVTMDDVAAFLPPGYKGRFAPKSTTQAATQKETEATTVASTTASSGFKVVFPSRPGGVHRKSSAGRLTTLRPVNTEVPPATVKSIQKGWPSRATTEFTGWPTPSTTPISIEKLLEAARNATFTTSSTLTTSSTTTSTTTTTTTTTTAKPTTPGICKTECDVAGTIKLVGGAKWVPELLDRNTREWQILANEVQSQLEDVYSKSSVLNKWYKKIRIDGFSEGSVLVDYLVELNDVGRQVDTVEIKKLFHETLEDAVAKSNREPKSSGDKLDGKLSLGNFIVDPKYTDFIILPKQIYPTVGYADENVLLPQWAIAVIVIGLASLLFVIIFGVTVLVNRQKNAKKKAPTPLTEDMLNELNKNHMGGGIDNYGADDLYNMEDVWNDRHPYETKLPKKRSTGSIHDNSMANLYDSWRSEWNGYYYNAYYGNNAGSSHGGYGNPNPNGNGRRRSDYDTNF